MAAGSAPSIQAERIARPRQAWLYGVGLASARIALSVVIIGLTDHIFPNGPFGGGTTLLDRFAHWDSGWLINIAQHGYTSAQASTFYPGVPLLMRALTLVSGGFLSDQSAAIAISWFAFIGSSVVLFHVVNRRFGINAAAFSTVMFAFWPGSVFFVSAYAESTVIFLTLLAALFIENKRYWGAAIACGFASLTAPVGAVFGLALAALILWEKRGVVRAVFLLLISEAGSLAYATYLWTRFGNPFENLAAQKFWFRHAVVPFSYLIRNSVLVVSRHIRLALGPLPPGNGNLVTTWTIDDLSGLFALVVLLGVLYVAVRQRNRINIPIDWLVFFVLALVLINSSAISFGSTPSTEAVARLVGSVFPLYPFTYLVFRRLKFLLVPILAVLASLAFVGQLLFALNFWFT